MRLFLGSPDGLALFEDGEVTPLASTSVLCAVRLIDGTVLAGTAGGSIVSWTGVGETRVLAKDLGEAVTSLALAKNGRLVAGCRPAGLWRSKDLGESWAAIASLAASPGADQWTGDGNGTGAAVSAVGNHHKDAKTIYVGIDAGGVYRSRDTGKTWYNLGLPCSDVQSIQLSAARPERVFVTTGGAAATGCGAYCSDDEGITWRPIGESNRRQFAMGLAAHPTEPDRVILSATGGPPSAWKAHAHCDVYLSTDSGRRFRTVVKDLKGGVRRRALVINPRVPSEAAFGTSTGELWYSNDGGESFDRVGEALPDLLAVAFA
ncbi:MAG: VPS10 domain-containing protein [Actinomycetota bacterium]